MVQGTPNEKVYQSLVADLDAPDFATRQCARVYVMDKAVKKCKMYITTYRFKRFTILLSEILFVGLHISLLFFLGTLNTRQKSVEPESESEILDVGMFTDFGISPLCFMVPQTSKTSIILITLLNSNPYNRGHRTRPKMNSAT
jgi:hypothetical protein